MFKFFKRPKPIEGELEIAVEELKLSGCPLCRPLVRGASATRTLHYPDKEPVELELIDERKNPNRKCLSLCVLNDPAVGWAECPVKYCPRCGVNLLALIRQNKDD